MSERAARHADPQDAAAGRAGNAPPSLQAPRPVPCLNCGEPLGGPYCAACGQRDRPATVTVRELMGEAVESLTSIDSAVLRSFAGLLRRPGAITSDYLMGRRARYLPPLRLYLLCSLAYALALEFRERVGPSSSTPLLNVTTTIDSANGVRRIVTGDSAVRLLLDSTSATSTDAAGTLWKRMLRGAYRDPTAFRVRLRAVAPKAFFFLVPAFALLLLLGFRRGGVGGAGHLVVALHLHATGFLLFALAALVSAIPPLTALGNGLALIGTLGFVIVALRRIYGASPMRTTLTLLAVLVPYFAMVTLATVVVIGMAAVGT